MSNLKYFKKIQLMPSKIMVNFIGIKKYEMIYKFYAFRE